MNTLDLSLAGEAYRVLEEKIVTLQLKPSKLCTEKDLVAITERGRTPTREAIQRLERDMLVQILPRQGILIEPIDIARALMTLDVRGRLEPMMMARAAKFSDDETKGMFRRLATRIEASVDGGEALEFPRLDRKFTYLAMECARHDVAARILLPLHAVSRRIGCLMAKAQQDRQGPSSMLHAAIAHAIASGDDELAESKTSDLINHGRAIARAIEEDGLDTDLLAVGDTNVPGGR